MNISVNKSYHISNTKRYFLFISHKQVSRSFYCNPNLF